MWRCLLVVFLLGVALAPSCMPHQKRAYTTEAGIDTDGNIYVVSAGAKIPIVPVEKSPPLAW